MKVTKGNKIKIDYELRVAGGQVIESSSDRGPLEYVFGEGGMLPAFEKRIDGMEVDEERSGTIPSDEALDAAALTKVIPRSDFPEGEEIEEGKRFEATGPDGPVAFQVVSIDDDNVTVQFLHPLAGKDIEYKVKLLAIEGE